MTTNKKLTSVIYRVMHLLHRGDGGGHPSCGVLSFVLPAAPGHPEMPRLGNMGRALRHACLRATCRRISGETFHQLGHRFIRKLAQVICVPKRAGARVPVVAVCQKSPEASVAPLSFSIRLGEPAHWMEDDNVGDWLQRDAGRAWRAPAATD